jgi:hypothetical protein
MRKLSMLILDEVIELAAGSADALTSEALSEPLGRYDRLALEVVAEDAVAGRSAPTLMIMLETSCDGLHWATKSQSPPVALHLTQATAFWFPDDGSLPSYALVRVRARLSCEGAARARVRVLATARDSGAHNLQGTVPTDAYQWVADAMPYKPPPNNAMTLVCNGGRF